MVKFDMTKAEEIINNIARKYSRNTSILEEDFRQDLWVKALTLNTENLAILTTSLVNYAIDLSRKSWKTSNHEYYDHNSYDYDAQDIFLSRASRDYAKNTYDIDGFISKIEAIRSLPEKERRFVVAKAYLNGGIEELRSDYESILLEIPEERLALLSSYDKPTYTDDIVLKVFVGIKTGVNAGSARAVKNNVIAVLLAD